MLAKDILKEFGSYVSKSYGDIEHKEAKSFKTPIRSDENSIIWISSRFKDANSLLSHTRFAIAICADDFEPSPEVLKHGHVLIQTEYPRLLAIKIAQRFFSKAPETFIHPTAIIHPEAAIGASCTIGAYSVIGKVSISDHVTVGEHVILFDGTKVGNNVSIGPSSILGSTQSANERDHDGKILSFPHLGGIVIGDDVTIGANCIIAKGILDDTLIEEGTIIDSRCLIGHNSHIGKQVFISSCCQIGGSVIINDKAILFSDVKTRQWITIGQNAVIGQSSLVIKDVPDYELWYGSPAIFVNRVEPGYRPFV